MLKGLQSGANALGKGEVDSSILSGSTSQVAIPSRPVVDLAAHRPRRGALSNPAGVPQGELKHDGDGKTTHDLSGDGSR
jgi:hypothetical protein